MTSEIPVKLSARNKGSFAYETVKDRLPVILTKAIDTCHKQSAVLHKHYGEEGAEDATQVVHKLSKLRNEMMTDKPLSEMEDELPDASKWNECLKEIRQEQKEDPSHFTSPWLYVECAMYRKITSFLQQSKFLKSFDPYNEQKVLALKNALPGLRTMADRLKSSAECTKQSEDEQLNNFQMFLKASLWSNRFDLSLSAGEANNHESHDPAETMLGLEKYLLADDSAAIFRHLTAARKNIDKIRVDLVVDNAGFEFSSDLILAEYLLISGMADTIHFHVKNMPWFVSDVTFQDFEETISQLSEDSHAALSNFAQNWKKRLTDHSFVLVSKEESEFWTIPRSYSEMSKHDPKLFKYLQNSNLIIFKGDMNFRRLVGDLAWGSETPFNVSLRGFNPAPLCTLRTLKAHVVVGLKPGVADMVCEKDSDWMVSGKYAVILAQL